MGKAAGREIGSAFHSYLQLNDLASTITLDYAHFSGTISQTRYMAMSFDNLKSFYDASKNVLGLMWEANKQVFFRPIYDVEYKIKYEGYQEYRGLSKRERRLIREIKKAIKNEPPEDFEMTKKGGFRLGFRTERGYYEITTIPNIATPPTSARQRYHTIDDWARGGLKIKHNFSKIFSIGSSVMAQNIHDSITKRVVRAQKQAHNT